MAALPDIVFWSSNPILSQVKANKLELKNGAADGVKPGQGGPPGAVFMVQQVLMYWGRKVRQPKAELLSKYGADGSFGEETRTALVLFQRAHKDLNNQPLEPDGILGDFTLGALERYVKLPPLTPDGEDPLADDVDDKEIIPFTVDVIAFPDGPEAHHVAQMLPIATKFFREKFGLELRRGTFLDVAQRPADRPKLESLARFVFDVNQPGKPNAGGTKAVVSMETGNGYKESLEVQRLRERINPRPITVVLVDQFPKGVQDAMGVTYTRETFKKAPLIFVAKSWDCMHVFWHEICHALLDTGLTEDDHHSGNIMDPKASPKSHDMEVRPEQRQKMRATARTLA